YTGTAPRAAERDDHFMNTQLHLAYGIVDGRAYSDQDRALLRNVELARQDERRQRRSRRRNG
ncbi:MAG: hypothetical protein JWO76_464, partial [Nocardioides sp.]|nr:hypothetical protein [Nocardioides sp.]